MTKKRRIRLIIACACMIVLGAAMGPIYIVMVAFYSGSELGSPIPLVGEGASLTITPDMNPVRLLVKVKYTRTQRILSTTVAFPYRIQRETGKLEEGTVGFRIDPEDSDALQGTWERSATMSIRDIQVEKPTTLTVWLDPSDCDDIELVDQHLLARKNVSSPNPAVFLPGCAAILIGILGSVYSGVKLALG